MTDVFDYDLLCLSWLFDVLFPLRQNNALCHRRGKFHRSHTRQHTFKLWDRKQKAVLAVYH